MRLHQLELTAFQAFAGRETVDFDALAESGLFLLHGPTGAGKTTILDAICFAFYGRLPGARREGVPLRSDHAAPGDLTCVTVEATLRGQRIRIRRQPAQERPKVRGAGFTQEAHKAWLEAIDADGTERVLATRLDEVDAELHDLLGMTGDQFGQIVLLPQGGFQRFLHASSDQRQEILEDLFDVKRFVAVERWLTERRASATGAAAEALDAVADVAARVSQAAGADAPEHWQGDPEMLRGWMHGLGVITEAGLATAESSAERSAETLAQARTALVAGVERNDRRRRHREAVEALATWETGRGERDERAGVLEAARRAAGIAPLLEDLAARERALAALTDADADADGDPAELRARAGRLRVEAGETSAYGAVEERCVAVQAELDALTARTAGAAARRDELRAWLDGAAARRAELAAGAEAARDAEVALPALADARRRSRHAHEEAVVRDDVSGRLETARDVLRKAVDGLQACERRSLGLREQRLAGMASVLAGELADGDACAVCGALEHPAPAAAPASGVPEASELQAAEQAVRDATGLREDATGAVATLEARLAAARASAGDDPVEALAATAEEASVAHTAASRLAAGHEAAGAALTTHDAGVAERRTTLDGVERAHAADTSSAERMAAAQMENIEHVMRAREGHASVAAHVDAIACRAREADTQADAVEARARARAERDRARAAAATAVAGAGFATVEAAVAAVRDRATVEALEQGVRAWDGERAERIAATRVPELVEAAGEPAADVAGLRIEERGAEELHAQAQQVLTRVRDRRAALAELEISLGEALDAAGPTAERLAVVRGLADLAEGRGANRHRMRLSAYVLAARLEEVAAAASVRLSRMSSGRFELEHATEGGTRRGRAGLDLRVIDAWTGRARPPASLSGGETFQASLALALGLADVVAAEAGGARLETLFVDEGFGSLDDEGTLDQVLDVLDDLRDSGRVVGVVSHVAELRQRIPGRLQITKTTTGSHVVEPLRGSIGSSLRELPA